MNQLNRRQERTFKMDWPRVDDTNKRDCGNYLQPASLRRWAYILPMSPMPMMPIEAFSFVRTMLANMRAVCSGDNRGPVPNNWSKSVQ